LTPGRIIHFSAWQAAFEQVVLNPNFYTTAPRRDEVFPGIIFFRCANSLFWPITVTALAANSSKTAVKAVSPRILPIYAQMRRENPASLDAQKFQSGTKTLNPLR
jgi:hypothetical protein